MALKFVYPDSCNITLAHPKYIKAIRGKKTDKKDAQWITDLFKHDLIALCPRLLSDNFVILCVTVLN